MSFDSLEMSKVTCLVRCAVIGVGASVGGADGAEAEGTAVGNVVDSAGRAGVGITRVGVRDWRRVLCLFADRFLSSCSAGVNHSLFSCAVESGSKGIRWI